MLSDAESAAVEAAVEVTVNYLDAAANRAASVFRQWRERRSAETGELFRPYYERVVKRCSTTKTFLNPRAAVPLAEFYVPMDVDSSHRVIIDASATQIFAEGPSILLTGGAGSGKSTLLKHLFLDVIYQKAGIPLFAELRHFNEFEGPYRDFLYAAATENGLVVSEAVFDDLLNKPGFILMLDGFDEVAPARAGQLARQIERFESNHDHLRTIVTSRPDYYRFVGWTGFKELTLKPLNKGQCLKLIERANYDEHAKASFARHVESTYFDTHRSFLENPLLTILMLLTFHKFGRIETRPHLFYGQAYETLDAQHDATKIGYSRVLHSGLARDELRAAVAAFAIQTYLESAVSFPESRALQFASQVPGFVSGISFSPREFIADLTSALCLLVQDGPELRFTHRSFQEYFAAIFLLYFARSRRRSFLRRIRHRLNSDATGQLMLAMDRSTFEEDFVAPAVEETRAFFRLDEHRDVTNALLAFLRDHTHISVGKVDIAVRLRTDEAVGSIELIRFVERHYHRREFAWVIDDHAATQALWSATLRSRVTDLVAEHRVGVAGAHQTLESLPSITIRDQDFDNGNIRALLAPVFAPVMTSVMHVLATFDAIEEERLRRDAAMERLLNEPPSTQL